MMMLNVEAINRLKKELNLRSYASLAKRIGISRATLWRYIKGKRQPSPKFIDGFKAAFPDRSLENYLIFTKNIANGCHLKNSAENTQGGIEG